MTWLRLFFVLCRSFVAVAVAVWAVTHCMGYLTPAFQGVIGKVIIFCGVFFFIDGN